MGEGSTERVASHHRATALAAPPVPHQTPMVRVGVVDGDGDPPPVDPQGEGRRVSFAGQGQLSEEPKPEGEGLGDIAAEEGDHEDGGPGVAPQVLDHMVNALSGYGGARQKEEVDTAAFVRRSPSPNPGLSPVPLAPPSESPEHDGLPVGSVVAPRLNDSERWRKIVRECPKVSPRPKSPRQFGEWIAIRVIVCGNYDDTYNEREILNSRVFPDLRMRLRQHKILLYDCDLRWARERQPTSADDFLLHLQQIDLAGSNTDYYPFMINIIGDKYGWVPKYEDLSPELRKEFDWQEGFNLSTNEIIHGAFRRGNPNAFFFLRDHKFMSGPFFTKRDVKERELFQDLVWNGKTCTDVLDETRVRKLSLLKKSILEVFPPSQIFKDYPATLAGSGTDEFGRIRLKGLEQFHTKAQKMLQDAIVNTTPAEEPATKFDSLAFHQQNFVANINREFVSRSKIAATLQQLTYGREAEQVIVLVGPAGCGKTALLANHFNHCSREPDIKVFSHFTGIAPNSMDVDRYVRRMCTELITEFAVEDEDIPQDYSEVCKTYKRLLQRAVNETNVVLIVDAANSFEDEEKVCALNWLPRGLEGVCCMTSTDEGRVLDAMMKLKPPPKKVEIPMMTKSEQREMIQTKLVKKIDDDQRLQPVHIDALLEAHSSSNPLWLSTVCLDLTHDDPRRSIHDRLLNYRPDTVGLFEQVFQRLEEKHSSPLVKDTVALIACSRNGLTETELRELCSKDGDFIPALAWARLTRDLRFCLLSVQASGEEGLSFCHSNAKAAARRRYLSSMVKGVPIEEKYHARLAQYFKEASEKETQITSHTDYPRAMREMTFHQRKANLKLDVVVAVRVRPFGRRELAEKAKCIIEMNGADTVVKVPGSSKAEVFTFDFSFWSHDRRDGVTFATQATVYNMLGAEMFQHVFDGYNVSFFAYGQTGSGKTYSIFGDVETPGQEGLVPLVCRELFNRVRENTSSEVRYQVTMSMIEIYRDTVFDLLSNKANFNSQGERIGLKVREDPVKGPYIENLRKQPVSMYDHTRKVITEGTRNRTIAATEMNDNSSRAHTLVTLYVQKQRNKENGWVDANLSKIHLVDLAGSERARTRGEATDKVAKEGIAINLSLTMLNRCISALAAGTSDKQKVPYRDSMLTWIMKDALGGRSKTIMLAAISPSDTNRQETMTTLQYASMAKRMNKAQIDRKKQNQKADLTTSEKESLAAERAAQAEMLVNSFVNDPHADEYIHQLWQADDKIAATTKDDWQAVRSMRRNPSPALKLVASGFSILLGDGSDWRSGMKNLQSSNPAMFIIRVFRDIDLNRVTKRQLSALKLILDDPNLKQDKEDSKYVEAIDNMIEWIKASYQVGMLWQLVIKRRQRDPYFEKTMIRQVMYHIAIQPRRWTLPNQGLTDDHAALIAEYLKHSATCEWINLEGNLLTDSGVAAVSEAISSSPQIQEVNLRDNKMGAEGARAITEALMDHIGVKVKFTIQEQTEWKGNSGLREANLLFNVASVAREMNEKGDERLSAELRNHSELNNSIVCPKCRKYYTHVNSVNWAIHIGLNYDGSEEFEICADSCKMKHARPAMGPRNAIIAAEFLKITRTITKVHIENHEIGDMGAEALAEALKENLSCRELYLRGNKITDAGASSLLTIVRDFRIVKHLDLEFNPLSPSGWSQVLNTLVFNGTASPRLEEAMVKCTKKVVQILRRHNKVEVEEEEDDEDGSPRGLHERKSTVYGTDNKRQSTGQAMATFDPLTDWTLADIAESSENKAEECWGENETMVVAKYITCDPDDIPLVRARDIGIGGAVALGETIATLVKFKTKSLKAIDIDGRILPFQRLFGSATVRFDLKMEPSVHTMYWSFLKHHPFLSVLDCSNNKMGSHGTGDLGGLVDVNGHESHLRFDHNGMEDTDVCRIADLLKHESGKWGRISFNHNRIGPTGAIALAGVLRCQTKLDFLNIGHNVIGTEGGKAIAHSMKNKIVPIKTLSLDDNAIGPEGATAFGDMLRTNRQLTHLNLQGNRIGDTGLVGFGSGLRKNRKLRYLSLEANDLGAEAVRAINVALQPGRIGKNGKPTGNTHLTSLTLRKNLLDADAVLVLGDVLKRNMTLTWLDLGKNKIGPDGINAMVDSLKRTESLTYINFEANAIGSGGAMALSRILKGNESITALSLDRNDLETSDVKAIFGALRDNQTLTDLSLAYNVIDDGISEAVYALQSNRTLARMNMTNNNVSNQSLDSLKKFFSKMEDEYLQVTLEPQHPRNLKKTRQPGKPDVLVQGVGDSDDNVEATDVVKPQLSKFASAATRAVELPIHAAATGRAEEGLTPNETPRNIIHNGGNVLVSRPRSNTIVPASLNLQELQSEEIV